MQSGVVELQIGSHPIQSVALPRRATADRGIPERLGWACLPAEGMVAAVQKQLEGAVRWKKELLQQMFV